MQMAERILGHHESNTEF